MPLKLIEGSKVSGLTLNSVLKGERCSICGIGLMTHPELYVYTCSNLKCKYSYKIEPVSRYNQPVIILKKSLITRRR